MNKSQRYCFGNRRGRGQIRDALTHAICSAERNESQAVPGRKRPDVVGYRSETCVYVNEWATYRQWQEAGAGAQRRTQHDRCVLEIL